MWNASGKKTFSWVVLLLFPGLNLSSPSAQAFPLPQGKAVIRSCANPPGSPPPYPLGGKTSTGGYGMPNLPPSLQGAAKTTMMPTTLSEAEAPAFPSTIKSKKPLDVHQVGKKVPKNIRKAGELYLSNDDSMSLASAQRLLFAINHFLPLYREEIRPHEFLNYFHFKTNPVSPDQTFSVNFQIAPRTKGESLAMAVQGKTLTKAQRRPAVMTLVLDKSGSMSAEGKMDYLKAGLEKLKSQFKKGDVINVVEFNQETCKAMEGFVVGRDAMAGYERTVKELGPRGSTDLHAGLVDGYLLAEKFFDPTKINRVILITDAIANAGELSPELMASIGKYYDTKRIALSGIGLGLDFNDELLDTLTEEGKGAYLFLDTEEAIPRVFGTDFIGLLDTVARDVHFKVSFPPGVHLETFYGEEVATQQEQVQPIHYFANSSQLFLLDLTGEPKPADRFQLKIEFVDPISGKEKMELFSQNLSMIENNGRDNIAKGRMIMAFAHLMETTALPGKRPYGPYGRARYQPKGKAAKEGKKKCSQTLTEMKRQAEIYSDTETEQVLDLANKYCARY